MIINIIPEINRFNYNNLTTALYVNGELLLEPSFNIPISPVVILASDAFNFVGLGESQVLESETLFRFTVPFSLGEPSAHNQYEISINNGSRFPVNFGAKRPVAGGWQAVLIKRR